MIIDSRSLPEGVNIQTDVCVVGAGVAGISLVRELKDAGFRVTLLEGGGTGPDKQTQGLYWGDNIGHPYFPLDTTRACGFGGTCNRWSIQIGDSGMGVRLRPLDELDFEEREWVPYSGWPFDKKHLDPFYERAQTVCQIGPYAYDVDAWEDPQARARLPLANDHVKTVIFQFGSRLPFIKDYPQEIDRADNCTVYTYANAVEIGTDESARQVKRLRARCLQGGDFWITAKLYVLAMGAIETVRLLLISDTVQKNGIGNDNDLVGRFFMEHPHLWSGIFVPADPGILDSLGLYRMHKTNGVPVMGKLALSTETLRTEKLLNYVTSLHPRYPHGKNTMVPSHHAVSWPLIRYGRPRDFEGVNGFQPVSEAPASPARVVDGPGNDENVKPARENIGQPVGWLRRAKRNITKRLTPSKPSGNQIVFRLNQMSEQAPNPDSRVLLSAERDALGRRRVRLNWQLSPIDMRTIIRAQQKLDAEFRRAALGGVITDLKDEIPPAHLEGGWHHMGTTRMHNNPKYGVVDGNARVHGMANLFVAGASVFPTGGYANPVLTTVALALRLADHIKAVMRS
jgi:choline dehydrogenase-like flavoprotein